MTRIFQGRKIHVAGTVQLKNYLENHALHDLLPHIFTISREEISALTIKEIVELIQMIEGVPVQKISAAVSGILAARRHDPITRHLPVWFHINQTDAQVSALLNDNGYSFLPMPRGATEHSSTLAASLAHKMITFVRRNEDGETPSCLENSGVYFLNPPDYDVLAAIKKHESRARFDPSYEAHRIGKGDCFRSQRNWSGLAARVNDMAIEALHSHARKLVSRDYHQDTKQRHFGLQ